jgi:hypothetical protein
VKGLRLKLKSSGKAGFPASHKLISTGYSSEEIKKLISKKKPQKKISDHGQINSFIQLCKQSGLPEPTAEYKFHPTRKWRIDYLFTNYGIKVGLEVEGGIYGKGPKCKCCGRKAVAGHTSIERLKNDIEKYNEITCAGIRLIRVQPENLMKKETIQLIKRALTK